MQADGRHVGSILGQEEFLEEGMPTHSSFLAWRIPWTEEPDGATVHGVAESRARPEQLGTQGFLHASGEDQA